MSAYILTKLTTYGNGSMEMTTCVQNPKDGEDLGPGQHVPSLGKPRQYHEDYAEGSAERAERRARQEIRKRMVEHRLDHLVTLTTRENVTDYDEALSMAQAFVKLVRASLPGWLYVMVPERQERGAWHWHLAAHGWQNVELLRHCWYTVSGCKGMNVKGPGRKGYQSTTYRWNAGRLAGYLLKYISKEIADRPHDMKGRHRYTSAHGMRTWDETHHAFSVETTLEEIVTWFSRAAGGVSKVWDGKWETDRILWAT